MSQIYCNALQSGLHSHRVKVSPWYKSFYMIFKREFCLWSSTKFVSVLELGKYITNCQQQDKLLRTEDRHTILYLNTKAPVLLSQKILELMNTESLLDRSEKNHYIVTCPGTPPLAVTTDYHQRQNIRVRGLTSYHSTKYRCILIFLHKTL